MQLIIVKEDFGGRSLKEFLSLEKKLKLTEVISIIALISKTLGEIHQQNIVHKDLNLSNLVWNENTGEVKIIDFGISMELSEEKPEIRNPYTPIPLDKRP